MIWSVVSSFLESFLDLEIILVVMIVVFGYFSWVFQRRSAIRRSIEQIEHIELEFDKKIVPTLRDFQFRLGLWPKTTVVVIQYDLGRKPESASLPGGIYFENFPEEKKDAIEELLEELDCIESVTLGDGFSIEFSTSNEVKINRGTSAALRAVWFAVNRDIENVEDLRNEVGLDIFKTESE